MADTIRQMGEVDVARLTKVARSTRTSWAKSGWISDPIDRRFDEQQVVEVALFADLSAALESAVAQAAWVDAKDTVLKLALRGAPGEHKRFDLLINGTTAAVEAVVDDRQIGEVVTQARGQPHTLIPVAQRINDVREGFWRYARLGKESGKGGRAAGRRSAKQGTA